jgi:IPT/TIG domain
MATVPTQVRPGDVITSDLINAILEKLAELGPGVSGTQVVPNVFGTFLGEARATILQPSRQLALGFTFDVTGAAIDPLAASNFNLIVLNQSPPADSLVPPNTPVNLVVSQAATGTTPTPVPAPTITRTETATGTATTSFAVNGTMAIVGTNFSANAAQNIVTFNNVAAASVTGDPADPTRRLLVQVPTGIPGAPVNPGDAALAGVVVSVRNQSGIAATTTITVTAPVPGQPTIASVSPATPDEGQNITVTGTNYTATTQVRIRGTLATTVGTPTPTSITVTVPNFPDITPGPAVPSSLVISVPGVGEVTFTGTFRIRGV